MQLRRKALPGLFLKEAANSVLPQCSSFSDFKQYVLGMLFYRYISENLSDFINEGEHEAQKMDFNYADLSDEEAERIREDLVDTKGFFILPSELFENVIKAAAKNENLNETLESVFNNIEDRHRALEANKTLKDCLTTLMETATN